MLPTNQPNINPHAKDAQGLDVIGQEPLLQPTKA
mgnify:CR=1 FL=1